MVRRPATVRLVGRDSQLALVVGAALESVAGEPRVVLVRGEAGIGKTRLIDDALVALPAARVVGSRPLVVVRTACREGGLAEGPLAPVRRLLRVLHRSGVDLAASAEPSPAAVRALATLVPDAAVAADRAGARTAATDSEASASVVVDMLERVIERLSDESDVVLVIEDLHWSDRATLDLLLLLASTLDAPGVTVVLSFRPPMPSEAGVAELERLHRTTTVELSPLSSDEIAEMLDALSPAGGAFDVREVERRSGGIPFLIEELSDLGGTAPSGALADVLLARFRRLPEPTRALVRLLSAAGGAIDHDAVATVSGLPSIPLEAMLREAIDEGVLTTDPEGYSFRHDLLREAVDAEVLPGERRRFHSAFMDALAVDPLQDFATAAQIAAHAEAAGRYAEAFDAAVVSISSEDADLFPAVAADMAELLLRVWSAVPHPVERAALSRTEVLRRAAEARFNAGDYAAAVMLLEQALVDVDGGSSYERASAMWWLVIAKAWATGNELDPEAPVMLDDAGRLLSSADDPASLALRARILSERAGATRETVRRAVALAQESGVTDAEVTCMSSLAWKLCDEGELDEALVVAQAAVTLPARSTSHFRASLALADILRVCGEYEESAELMRAECEAAAREGRERGIGAALRTAWAESLLALGRADESETQLRRAARYTRVPADAAFSLEIRAERLLWAGDVESYASARRIAAELLASPPVDRPLGTTWRRLEALRLLLELELETRSAQRARIVSELIPLLEGLLHPGLEAWTLRDSVMLASWFLGSPACTRSAAVEALDYAVSKAIGSERDTVRTAFMRAAVRDAGATPEDRVAAWREVEDRLRPGRGLRAQLALLSRLKLADALRSAGDRVGAGRRLAELAEDADRQGAGVIAAWARVLAERAGIVHVEGIAALSSRENEVLDLVAQGLTNAQVGRALFISPKTVSVHVSSILAKTGTANRTEATALLMARLEADQS